MSCREQGILTKGPAPYPKCKLYISSFLTLPHPLECLICAKDIMIIALLLQIMGGWEGWGREGGGSFMLEVGWGTGVGYHIFSIFCSAIVRLLIVLS